MCLVGRDAGDAMGRKRSSVFAFQGSGESCVLHINCFTNDDLIIAY